MEWKPSREDKKPLYQQIAEYFERQISSGNLPPSSTLPSERALATKYSVNRSTIVAAYDELQAMGLVNRVKGSGTIVSSNIWGRLNKRIPNWNQYVDVGSFLPNVPIVQRLREETKGQNVINLMSGELSDELFPNEQFQTILSERPFREHLGYDDPQGSLKLREAIEDHVRDYRKIDTTASSILITSGAQQALHLIVQGLLQQGDAVAIEDPSYSYTLPLFRSAGLKVFHLKVDNDGVNPSDLVALHKKHRIRMVFLNPIFQNPTGAVLSEERRKQIVDISAQFGIPIIEDDPYSLTAFSGGGLPPLKSSDQNGNVLYISSLSKTVASGLRIGWIIGPAPVILRLADIKQQVDFGHSVFPQWVAKEFLRSSYFDEHIQTLRKKLEERKKELVNSLQEFLSDQVEFVQPQGGIHLWCKIKGLKNENLLMEESIKRGVVYTPGRILGSQSGYVRFTYGRGNEHQIREGIKRFKEALDATNLR
ncbi:MocR-like pyridoxine biosynthesis transcription factor PdxR [Halalkalibacter krulwichiae]|uniref:HTH-type transcriptional regulator NorG n=1 Tax=Halalkalibacter krulwichiae TaxID=199441 RepID=A0A1X9MHY3_9BACI|nr:PLP-dependent aminotransferase family protein [Halalkalibacter krulwichiae]ARK32324.1 HTH-type transcriptional regulator NorG [Halalkalibacter krulwichiae]